MRIPLDYYRILGLLMDAEPSAIESAYQDRKEQQPRREYSELALRSRQNLMDEAYLVLSNPSRRQEYDRQLWEKPAPPKMEIALPNIDGEQLKPLNGDSHAPSLKIQAQYLGGALSILQELGEYEIVSNIGRRELKNRLNYDLEEEELWRKDRSDIALSVALSCLQRGREEYEKRDYEAAATCQQEGWNLLRQEGILPFLQEELQTELYSLRPYRVLSLLALELDRAEERQKGLQLLQEMLGERGGLEGGGDDRSGLNDEEFLRFIEQLRNYLTVEEQLQLFELESARPSAAATYLLAYSLLAKGFARKQPQAIVRAKDIFQRFNPRQDLYLERAICALLLGQPDTAGDLLVKSQETDSIDFIRKHSDSEGDLLPGLCLYGERWLEGEVLSQFRDLRVQKLCLRDYFGDYSVQEYLDDLARHERVELDRELQEFQSMLEAQAIEELEREIEQEKPIEPQKHKKKEKNTAFWQNGRAKATNNRERHVAEAHSNGRGAMATVERTATEVEEDRPDYFHNSTYLSQPDWAQIEYERRPPRRKSFLALIPSAFGKKIARSSRENGRDRSSSSRSGLLTLTGSIALVLLAWFFFKPTRQVAEVVNPEQPSIAVSDPALEIPRSEDKNSSASNEVDRSATAPIAIEKTVAGDLTQDNARQVVEKWLTAKSAAMGDKHDPSQLTGILDSSLLQLWQGRSRNLQGSSDYFQYEHTIASVTVKSLKKGKTASIQAKVREKATYYRGQTVNKAKSYDQNLVVNYDLVWKNNHWSIASIRVD